jgi:hypothetical protein
MAIIFVHLIVDVLVFVREPPFLLNITKDMLYSITKEISDYKILYR